MQNSFLAGQTVGLDKQTDLYKLLVRLADITTELLSADRASIFLYDSESNELFTFIAHGVKEIRLPVNAGIVGYTFSTGKTLNIPDAYNEPLFNKENDIKTGYRCKAILSLPIINSRGLTIGVFQVVNKVNAEVFNDEDLGFLQQFSTYACSLLEKALIYKESITVRDEQIRALQTLTAGKYSSDLESIRTSVIPLYIGDNPELDDLVFEFPGLKLEIFKIANNFLVLQKDDRHQVFLGNFQLKKGVPAKILYNTNLVFNDYTIAYDQLQSYFKIKLNPYNSRTYYLTTGDEGLVLLENTVGTHLGIVELNKAQIRFYGFSEHVELVINRKRINYDTFANINDDVTINNRYFNLRKFIFEQLIEKEFIYFDAKEKRYTISNICGDVLIPDSLDISWEAKILKTDNGYLLENHTCPYDVYLNDRKVKKAMIKQDDRIYINGHIILLDLKNNALEKTKFSFRNFWVESLKYTFSDQRVALDELSFKAEHNDLIGIMGPSGCGKSTLLNILNGYTRPTSGEVLVDNRNLHTNYQFFKQFLGFVPQDDLLFDNLTVYENLYYNARLRFPDKSRKNIKILINRVLKDIGLTEKQQIRVGNALDKSLSGGERKRLNIGLELLSDSEIYLLDEPTSGLSSKDSEKIIDLLSKISLAGKMVFVIIHQPGSHIYKKFDKIMILDKGGRLAYFGEIYAGLEYFNKFSSRPQNEVVECPHCHRVDPDLLLETLEEPQRDTDGTPLPLRKYSPEFWKKNFEEHRQQGGFIKTADHSVDFIPPKRKKGLWLQFVQFMLLLERNFINKLKDKSNLAITFLEAPLLALVISLLMRYQTENGYSLYNNKYLLTYIFLTVIVTVFMAMTNSIDEIIRDASILLRERMLDIKNLEYYTVKFITLLFFAVIQNLLFLKISFFILEIKELFWYYFLTLSSISMAGIAIGLFISAIPKLTAKAAQNAIPLLLVPQIIFGGYLVEFKDMNKVLALDKKAPIPEICQIMPSRWGYEALAVLQDRKNSYQSGFEKFNFKIDSIITRQETVENEETAKELENQKNQLFQAREEFNGLFKSQYGNSKINEVVQEGDELLQTAKDSLQSQKTGSQFYPMYVSRKDIAGIDKNVSSSNYNNLVLLAFTILFSTMTLILLGCREAITHFIIRMMIRLSQNPFNRKSS